MMAPLAPLGNILGGTEEVAPRAREFQQLLKFGGFPTNYHHSITVAMLSRKQQSDSKVCF